MGTPTYVIGLGGVGVDVLTELDSRRSQRDTTPDSVATMAVDSCGETLDNLRGATTIELASDDGLVGDVVASYPFLSDNMLIPAGDANRQRHIGRYKLDNPVSPGYQEYHNTLSTELEKFADDCQTALSQSSDSVTVNVVLATSFGGGTGSGVFPLLATILDHLRCGPRDLSLRIVGIGVVPPLNFDPERGSPPAERYTYPNTYGALRNLATLLDADGGDPLAVPIYSTVDPADVNGSLDFQADVDRDGIVLEVEDSPFDVFWLVSAAHGRGERITIPERTGAAPSVIAGAIDALANCSAVGSKNVFHGGDAPPFGTIGYGALTVPHRRLRTYCEKKQERDDLRARLEHDQKRLDALRNDRDRLQGILSAQAKKTAAETDWLGQIRSRLDDDLPDGIEFVIETATADLKAVLDSMRDDYTLSSYFAMLRGLEQELARGRIQQAVLTELERTDSQIRSHYGSDPIPDSLHRQAVVSERLATLEEVLTEQIEECRRRLNDTEFGLRDVFPPEYVTSERERIEEQLEILESDRERVRADISRFESYQGAKTTVEDRLQATHNRIQTRLNRIESDITHVREHRADTQAALDACRETLASLRVALAEPTNRGPEMVLPLDHRALGDVTIEDIETELTSLRAYIKTGLLAVDDQRLTDIFEQCLDYSRGWPKSISQHDVSDTTASGHEETLILSPDENQPLVANLCRRVSETGTLRTSAEPHIDFTGDPYRIDVVSRLQKGRPGSLVGYQWLAEQAESGDFDAYSRYQDHRRALAYPEWYESDVIDGFD